MATVFAFAILITYSWAEQNLGEEFPLGVMGGSYTDTHLDFLEQLGFNYVFSFGLGPHTDNASRDYAWQWDEQGKIKIREVIRRANEFLTKAQTNGLKVAVYINVCKKTDCSIQCNGGDWAYDENAAEILRTFAAGVKDHPAFGFWLLADEPTRHCVRPEFLDVNFYSILKETGKPVANVQCDCSCKGACPSGYSPEFDWDDFSKAQDIIMIDRYPVWDQPFPDSSTEVTWDDRNITIGDYGFLSKAFSQSGGNDVIPMYQCYKHGKYTSGERKDQPCSDCRCPVYEEVRYWLFSSLAVGAKGVFFYSFTEGIKAQDAYQGCGGMDYFNSVFRPSLQEVNDFIGLVGSRTPTKIISGRNLTDNDVYLALYDKQPAGTWVILANNSETARTLSLNIGSELANTYLLPWGATRNATIKTNGSGGFEINANYWEVFVWKVAEAQCGNQQCETELGETASSCPADCSQECIITAYISQWKRGEITMLTLMQKMKQWKAGTGCPPGQ